LKHPIASFVCAFAIVVLAATGSALAAPGRDVFRLHAVMAKGTLSDPNITLSCPSSSPLQPVSIEAFGSGVDLTARGSMSLDTVELGSCKRIEVDVRVDCLLVDGSKAVVFGKVLSIVPSPSYPINLFAVDLRDNGPTGDKGKLIPLNIPTPASCALANLPLYFGFGSWPFVSGGVTIFRAS
jgi:hypothetical protein